MMSVGELSTAVSLKLHITILIMNDDKYGMIRWKQVRSTGHPPRELYVASWAMDQPFVHSSLIWNCHHSCLMGSAALSVSGVLLRALWYSGSALFTKLMVPRGTFSW